MSNITVDCAVCGKHPVNVPARVGTYRVKCPNSNENWNSTVVIVTETEVKSYQGPNSG